MNQEVSKKIQKESGGFSLIINNPDHASPFLQFSWCISESGLDYMKSRNVVYPFLLVSFYEKTNYDEGWDAYDCKLFPLDRGMGHIEFIRPGRFRINASVVWVEDDGKKNCQNKDYCRRDIYDKYVSDSSIRLHDFVNYRPEYFKHPTLPYHDEIEIVVDENLFAPEPSKTLKWWVNWLHNSRPKNQCQWRRRKWFAFSIKPFLAIIFLFCRSVTAVIKIAISLLIGYYPQKIRWRAVFHPFEYNHSAIVSRHDLYDKRNYWCYNSLSGNERSVENKIIMNPITLYLIAIISLAAVNNNSYDIENIFGSFFAFFILIICIVFWVLFLSGAFYKLLKLFFGNFIKKMEKISLRRKEEVAVRRLDKIEQSYQKKFESYYTDRLQPLSCVVRSPEATLGSLPKSHRTIELRYLDLKVKICKPFRR